MLNIIKLRSRFKVSKQETTAISCFAAVTNKCEWNRWDMRGTLIQRLQEYVMRCLSYLFYQYSLSMVARGTKRIQFVILPRSFLFFFLWAFTKSTLREKGKESVFYHNVGNLSHSHAAASIVSHEKFPSRIWSKIFMLLLTTNSWVIAQGFGESKLLHSSQARHTVVWHANLTQNLYLLLFI